MPKKLLFVVHRYPHPSRPDFVGGSEYNVQRLAEEAVRQGHFVMVLADTHRGNLNGVLVTNDYDVLLRETWDMIFVHGSMTTQDIVHHNADLIAPLSPIYYLLVEPPKNAVCWMSGMKHAKWIGWGTSADLECIRSYGYESKAHQFIYGIPNDSLGEEGFKERYGIPNTSKMYVSAGGFWPHKRHRELADAFRQANPENTQLVLLGYDNQHGALPTQSENVHVIMGASQQDVYDAMFEADLYILNSESEGYGLVLLEAMNNGCKWIATDIAAAHDLAREGWGTVYSTTEELVSLLRTPPPFDIEIHPVGMQYAMTNHSITRSINNLLQLLDS